MSGIATLLRSHTGKVHLGDADGRPRCRTNVRDVEELSGPPEQVTCGRCRDLLDSLDATGFTAPLAVPRATAATAGPAATFAEVDDDEIQGPLALARRLAAPLAFAVLGSAGAVWLVRRRRR
ncbi:MAG: hypothetical protein M3501_04685 [Actinomycetota bacterium]|nr:hypothetical protein [Actinomycetota bacterium]